MRISVNRLRKYAIPAGISRDMNESAFLDDVSSFKELNKIGIRLNKKSNPLFHVGYEILPITKICTVCSCKKHFLSKIINNQLCFVCPECNQESLVYIRVKFRNDFYRIDHDEQGIPFKTTNEARFYINFLDDKAQCGTDAHVYFIQAESNGYIKIGFSTNIRGRLTDLRISCPCKLSILLILAGGVNIETLHHNHFKDCHSHGEWFRPDDRLLKYIEDNKPFCRKKTLNIS